MGADAVVMQEEVTLVDDSHVLTCTHHASAGTSVIPFPFHLTSFPSDFT
jgi:molybdopterin biosynthesis enzyme